MAYLGREAAKAPIVTADLPNDGVTLAKMTGGTDGNIISYDASGDPVAIATGDDGEVLTSTGAGSPPAFEAAAGGGLDGVTTGSGNVTITNGNLVIGTSGKGIDFSAAGNVGGMTSELLDDYEEGTWTPAQSGVSGTSITFSEARYTKIGRTVYLCFRMAGSSLILTYNSSIITGQPFAPASVQCGSWIINDSSQHGSIYSTGMYVTALTSTSHTVNFSITYDIA